MNGYFAPEAFLCVWDPPMSKTSNKIPLFMALTPTERDRH